MMLRCRQNAFTLIELMVSMAVLAVLVVLVAQLMNGATQVTVGSGQRVDADSQARTVFDRMSEDFAHMVIRPDVDFVFKKQSGNDEAYFFSDAPALAPGSGMAQPRALVGYRIKDDKLERLGQGLAWTDMVHLTFPAGETVALADSTLEGSPLGSVIGSSDDAYHVLADGVFRLEFSFLLKPAAGQAGHINPSPFVNSPAGTINNTDKSKGGLSNVQAVIVTLGIIDERGRLLATNVSSGALGTFAAALADAAAGDTPAQSWQTKAEEMRPGQVRIYQRLFPLDTAGPR
jgi:prepilin-type N-terminal cleavage/methylation domain-containing protein